MMNVERTIRSYVRNVLLLEKAKRSKAPPPPTPMSGVTRVAPAPIMGLGAELESEEASYKAAYEQAKERYVKACDAYTNVAKLDETAARAFNNLLGQDKDATIQNFEVYAAKSPLTPGKLTKFFEDKIVNLFVNVAPNEKLKALASWAHDGNFETTQVSRRGTTQKTIQSPVNNSTLQGVFRLHYIKMNSGDPMYQVDYRQGGDFVKYFIIDATSSTDPARFDVFSDRDYVVKDFSNLSYEDADKYLLGSVMRTAYDDYVRARYDYQQYTYEPTSYRKTAAPPPKSPSKNQYDPTLFQPKNDTDNPLPWSKGDAYELIWVNWPIGIDKLAGSSFGKASDSDSTSGTGPGERWLGWIFGGEVKGGSVSFDIVIDGMKCESKGLEKASDLIRPGTEGLRAYEPAREMLELSMRLMREFVKQYRAQQTDFDAELKTQPEDVKEMFYRIIDFIDDEYENIVSKGEIAREKFAYIRRAFQAVSDLKKKFQRGQSSVKPDVKLSNEPPVTVSRTTFINVVNTVERDIGGGKLQVFSGEQKLGLALDVLKSDAFENPTEFFNNFAKSINLDTVFEEVDGVFIVNEKKGFCWIPKKDLKSVLRFNSISQAKPKFAFTMFDSAPEVTFDQMCANLGVSPPTAKKRK